MREDKTLLPLSRRHFIQLGLLSGSALFLPSSAFCKRLNSTAHPRYPQTIAALQKSYKHEVSAHRHYVAFSKKAKEDNYPNISYLFTALATSELIHSRIFRKILIELDAGVEKIPEEDVRIAKTKTNLKKAANHEIDLIEKFYPETMRIIRREKHQAALTGCRYSWESHLQHREKIHKINKWTSRFFQTVAGIIEKETTLYYICFQCGSTLSGIPRKTCPICYESSKHYKRIERNEVFSKALV
jgi:rubrerythrin